jgi:hypothetical protein
LPLTRRVLEAGGFAVEIEMNQPGYVRAIVARGRDRTKIEWAHDSAWRSGDDDVIPHFGRPGGVLPRIARG